jgi:deoxyribonuclease-4
MDSLRATVVVYDSADEYRPAPEPERAPLAWCDGSIRVGIHTSIAKDLAGAIDSAHRLGCNALQIFSGSPRMWPRAGSRIAETEAQRFRTRRAELGLGPLVIHANYLINLASPDRVTRARSIQALHNELVRATSLGADLLVLHPGSGRGGDRAEAIRAVAEGLRQAARGIRFHEHDNGKELAFRDLHRGGLRILLENTAGMGASIGSRFEELRDLLTLVPDLPLGICLDTAHAFAAGYAIHTAEGLEATIAELEATVTLERLAIVHINDSKTAFGSRVDRHEHVGRGRIGHEAFERILRHPRLSAATATGLPGRGFILETPIDAPGDDRRNVRAAWELAGVKVKQVRAAVDGFRRSKRKKPLTAAPAREAKRARSKAKR